MSVELMIVKDISPNSIPDSQTSSDECEKINNLIYIFKHLLLVVWLSHFAELIYISQEYYHLNKYL